MSVFALTVTHADRDGEDWDDIREEVLLAPLVYATLDSAKRAGVEYLRELYADVEMETDAPTSLDWGLGLGVLAPRIKEWRTFNEETGAWLQVTELEVLP